MLSSNEITNQVKHDIQIAREHADSGSALLTSFTENMLYQAPEDQEVFLQGTQTILE
ncbi:MAG: hypothetical protein U5J63_05015 [Fodinibius sp.]|nr:hypothetical protein [Fodinibius sp.]